MPDAVADLIEHIKAIIAKAREDQAETAQLWADLLKSLEVIARRQRQERGEDGFDG